MKLIYITCLFADFVVSSFAMEKLHSVSKFSYMCKRFTHFSLELSYTLWNLSKESYLVVWINLEEKNNKRIPKMLQCYSTYFRKKYCVYQYTIWDKLYTSSLWNHQATDKQKDSASSLQTCL